MEGKTWKRKEGGKRKNIGRKNIRKEKGSNLDYG